MRQRAFSGLDVQLTGDSLHDWVQPMVPTKQRNAQLLDIRGIRRTQRIGEAVR